MIYAKTGKKPSALATRPAVPDYLIEYWNGFVALDGTRGWNMNVPRPIQFSEVVAYSEIQGFSGEFTVTFAHIIQRLDARFLNWWADKNGKT